MAKLTDEMKDLIKNQSAFIATASPDGVPNLGPKGSFKVLDDEHIGWNESTSKHTYANLQQNPKVAVAVLDREKRVGYRFLGKAELLTSGALYDTAKEANEKQGRRPPTAVVRIFVDEIFSLGPPQAGEKIA